MAKAPVWFNGTDALVKVPKFSVTCVTRLVGDHGTDAPSALMAVSGGGGETERRLRDSSAGAAENSFSLRES